MKIDDEYEAVLWTLEKLRKIFFCFKMINFLLQRNDKKLTLLLIYHINSFKESIVKNYQINR